jgi:transposase
MIILSKEKCMRTEKKSKASSESIVREIKRRTRRKFTAEEKIRIILEGLRGEESIADICRKEGIHPTNYYKWSKSFLESGKRQLNGDTIREASSSEVKELRDENDELKMLVAEVILRNRVLKKTLKGLEHHS